MQSARSLTMRRALAQAARGPALTATSSPAAVLARRSVSHIAASNSTSKSKATKAKSKVTAARPIVPTQQQAAPQARHESSSTPQETLSKTPLYDLHMAYGAKMVPFGGFHMPVQYKDFSVSESHVFTRQHSSIFDVSHMVQRYFSGPGAAYFLQRITPSYLTGLPINRGTLSTLLHPSGSGGIIDDTIITRLTKTDFYVVTNAGCRAKDDAYLAAELAKWNRDPDNAHRQATQADWSDRGLIALQGPESQAILSFVLADNTIDLSTVYFGQTFVAPIRLPSLEPSRLCIISRGGYTGEDGFEISIPGAQTADVTRALLEAGGPTRVRLAGLGARDSLRLEAGMCLYGHDLDEATTPVEAGLGWIVPKERRGLNAGYYGADKITRQLIPISKGGTGVERRRVGLVVEGAPAREGVEIVERGGGPKIGVVTSGCPSPTLGINIAMGYIKEGMHKVGTEVDVMVRGKPRKAMVVKMPFVEAKYYKNVV
ncbi:hypothetical protein QBC39DRAFT_157680 [Podospora conica]|nr:hypothetical protein QBC39DRAFT_157680 [Schizothecium conicum]